MTEKKKRGLLSWLGFGDDDQVKQPEPAQSEEVISESDEKTVESVEPIVSQEVVEEVAVEPISESEAEEPVEVTPVVVEAPRVQEQEKPTESFFARLKRSLSRTKANIVCLKSWKNSYSLRMWVWIPR